jgi:hypothetical protein
MRIKHKGKGGPRQVEERSIYLRAQGEVVSAEDRDAELPNARIVMRPM